MDNSCFDTQDDIWQQLDKMRNDYEDESGGCSGASSPKFYFSKANSDISDDPSEDPIPTCGSCGSCEIIADEGQNVCMSCNTIQSRVIDTGAEWRFYGNDDHRDGDPTRCGMPTNDLLPKSSLGSVIGGSRGCNRDMRHIRMYQMWNSMPYWERTLYAVFEKLANSTAQHSVPNKVIDDAKVLYKRASEKKISRGDNKDGLIASCIYYACLMNKLPRSPKEVARMFNIDANTLTKGNARFQNLLQINVSSTTPDDYIARFGSKLKMDYNDIQECKSLAKRLDDLEIVSENAPTSVAAGTIYFYCILNNINLSKKDIADTCEVSEVTITKCYKRLQKFKKIIGDVVANGSAASVSVSV